jgi:AraC-like DNA-binding protein
MAINSFFKYLSHGVRDEAWGLYGTTVGAVEIGPGDEYPYRASEHPPAYTKNWQSGRTLNEFQFIYIARGGGFLHSDAAEYSIPERTLFAVFPGIHHWYGPEPGLGWTEYWVGFDGDIPRRLGSQGFLDAANPILARGESGAFMPAFTNIMDIAREERPGYHQLLGAYVLEILARARYRGEEPVQDHRIRELVDKVKEIFQEHIYDSLDVEAVARGLGQNYKSFREEFKNYTGLSPYQYFLHMKINKAKELLGEGIYSVKEVSYKLAFQNPYYFSRLFKKKTGVSPSQWNGLSIPES